MALPWDIRIFSWIYESGRYLLLLLFILYPVWLIFITVLRRRKQFLLAPAVFGALCLCSSACTWSGWHYRMALRERYAAVPQRITEAERGRCKKVYDIALMPPRIRKEYEKAEGRPRFRDVKAQVIMTVCLFPAALLGQGLLYLLFFRRDPPKEMYGNSASKRKRS